MERPRAVVFLDRDGTINEDVGYLSNPDELVLINGAAGAIARLNRRGVKVIVVTNQSGIGRGYYTEEDLKEINRRLESMLSTEDARLDGIYYCPHYGADCGCRKPLDGMARRAAEEHGLDGHSAYMVGDKVSDMGLAGNIGAKAVLVLTGDGAEEAGRLTSPVDFIARDLSDAVDWILADLDGKKT